MENSALLWVGAVLVVGILMFIGWDNIVLRKNVVEKNIPAVTDDEAMTVDAIFTNMIGSWQSLDDNRYILVLREDNTYEDKYEDKLVGDGTWSLFTDPVAQGVDIETSFQNSVFLEKKESSTGELFYYNIGVANQEELTITYLLGDVLRFKRIQ